MIQRVADPSTIAENVARWREKRTGTTRKDVQKTGAETEVETALRRIAARPGMVAEILRGCGREALESPRFPERASDAIVRALRQRQDEHVASSHASHPDRSTVALVVFRAWGEALRALAGQAGFRG